MAEWPRAGDVVRVKRTENGGIVEFEPLEIIPADLGRELYEALSSFVHEPDSRWDWEAMHGTLARYEREVGE